MRTENLKKIGQAPEKGTLYALTKTGVILEQYGDRNTAAEILKRMSENTEILELHLFDCEKEYRAVSTDGKRVFEGSHEGIIEHIADWNAEEDIFQEKHILLEKEFSGVAKRIRILNHISYNENGMAVIDDYRLVLEEN